ncbi:MAG: hypothetical protein CMA06_02470 [Euryarchaeota archaeon]|nr:hypothetical protein [Euryarchaeota archaeon]
MPLPALGRLPTRATQGCTQDNVAENGAVVWQVPTEDEPARADVYARYIEGRGTKWGAVWNLYQDMTNTAQKDAFNRVAFDVWIAHTAFPKLYAVAARHPGPKALDAALGAMTDAAGLPLRRAMASAFQSRWLPRDDQDALPPMSSIVARRAGLLADVLERGHAVLADAGVPDDRDGLKKLHLIATMLLSEFDAEVGVDLWQRVDQLRQQASAPGRGRGFAAQGMARIEADAQEWVAAIDKRAVLPPPDAAIGDTVSLAYDAVGTAWLTRLAAFHADSLVAGDPRAGLHTAVLMFPGFGVRATQGGCEFLAPGRWDL